MTYYVMRCSDGAMLGYVQSKAEAIAKASQEAVRLQERMEILTNAGAHVCFVTSKGLS